MDTTEKNQQEPLVSTDRKKKVGSYILGRTLGEGSFAKVRMGFHVIAREKVAIKVVSKKDILLREYVRRNVRREAVMLQKLQHPNIIRMYEVMETENTYYLVLEFAEGGEFLRYLAEKKYLSEYECRKFIRQLASAIDHMHRSSIVHRDLKMENFLLDKDLNMKIIDFGLSNMYYGDTSLNTQCGSPAYAAPEVFANQKYGTSVDVWSCGVCMYAMLIGRLPFVPQPENNLAQLHALILKGATIPDYLSTDCKDLLERMLQVESRKRIRIDDVIRHVWLSPEYEEPIMRQPTLPNITKPPPQGSIINYMANMFNFRESDILASLEEKKVNAIAATYYLLQKRFESGLHLVGFSVEASRAKRDSTFSSKSAPSSNAINTYCGRVPAGVSTPMINPSSYKFYLQYVKDTQQRNTSRAKQRDTNLLLQRQKTSPPAITPSKYAGRLSDNSYGYMYYPDFRLTCSPAQDHLYDWGTDAIIRMEDCNLTPKHNVNYKADEHENGNIPIKQQVQTERPVNSQSPLVPPNTSQGPRQSSVDELSELSECSYQRAGTPSICCKSPLPSKPLSPNKIQRSPRRLPQRNIHESKVPEDKDKLSINVSDQLSVEETLQRQKSKLAKGVTFTLSKSKTIFAKPISSQKFLTPRTPIEDMRQAQIVGKGRIMVERSSSRSIASMSLLPEYVKPRTAIGTMRERFPDVVSSTNKHRAKSDYGTYPNNDIAHLPDLVGTNSDSPTTPPTPIEKLIVEDEVPMMRIRITSFQKQ